MSTYDLIEYSNVYSKTSGSLWQYYRDNTLDNNNNITHFPTDNCISFKFTQKITG